jgi:hypothetical protein
MVHLPAAVATAWFFRSTQLASRVPLQVPGSTMLLIGSILTAIYLVIPLFAPTVEVEGVRTLIDRRSLFIILAARALLAVGAVKLLLSARPTNLSLQEGNLVSANRASAPDG